MFKFPVSTGVRCYLRLQLAVRHRYCRDNRFVPGPPYVAKTARVKCKQREPKSRPDRGAYRSTARSDKVRTQFVRRIDYFELDAISRRLVDGRTLVAETSSRSAAWPAAAAVTLLQRSSWQHASDCTTKRGLTPFFNLSSTVY